MIKSEFAQILTALFNGNAGEAEQTAEAILYDNKVDLSEEWERQRQENLNFSVANYRRICYNNNNNI